MSLVHPRDIICNYLARIQAERTRYGQENVIHVSDLVTRKDFVYISRTISPVPMCHHLARMYTGYLWEKELIRDFQKYGYVHEPEYHARIRVKLRYPSGREEEREYTLLGHPDFVLNPTRPEHIIEMKTTRWEKQQVISIVQGQYRTLRAFGVEIPQPFGLDEEDKAHFPAFFNWVLQCAWYRWWFGRRRKVPFTLLVIYRDAVEEIELPERALFDVWNQFWELDLKKTIVALDLARRYGYQQNIPKILALLDHLYPTGLFGYISNDEQIVLQGWTLPYMKLTTPVWPDDLWIFNRWAYYWHIPRRPPLARERINNVTLGYADAKRLYIDWLVAEFIPAMFDVAKVLIEHVDIPEVEIRKIEPIGVSRSPLQITEEAIIRKIQRIEKLLTERGVKE